MISGRTAIMMKNEETMLWLMMQHLWHSSLSDSLGFYDHRDKNVLNYVTVVVVFYVFRQITLPP